MKRLRVLITNVVLSGRTGTETYVADLARSLLDRGHLPIIYSPILGATAEEVRRDNIPVVDNLEQVAESPDIIHGHHGLETMTALLHFPKVPAVFVCHDALSWRDVPPRFSRIRYYVAVDDNCRDRLIYEYGIPPEQTRVLLNSVDLSRFKPCAPLPLRPSRALIFGRAAFRNSYAAPVRDACKRHGISVDVIGWGNRVLSEPEKILGQYDIVFAKARCALEAMAVGTAVILCDARGMGPLVTSAELQELRQLNFGAGTLRWPVTAENVAREIARYDRTDATEVSRRIRAGAGLEDFLDQLLALYREVIINPQDRPQLEEAVASSRYLRQLSLKLAQQDGARASSATIRARNRLLNSRFLGFAVRWLVRRLDGYRWR